VATFHEGGDEWMLDSIEEVACGLEWLDSDDLYENAPDRWERPPGSHQGRSSSGAAVRASLDMNVLSLSVYEGSP